MPISIRPFDLGCEPSPSIPAETLLQDAVSTYLLFFAVSKTLNEQGYLSDLGVAVIECENCIASKFGYPNDEGRPEHPLYAHGLSDPDSSVLEVAESPWLSELSEQMTRSTKRIWGDRSLERSPNRGQVSRHFIVLLKERTFECIATNLVVKHFSKSFREAHSYVQFEFEKH